MINPNEVPGFREALSAIRRAGGVLLPFEAAAALAASAIAAAAPHIRAETLADTADDILDMALAYPPGPESGVLLALAGALDQISFTVRKELAR